MAGVVLQPAEPRPPAPWFPPRAVLACLARIQASRYFVRSRRLSHFLDFVVHAALEGRSDEIKEHTIAVEVYGRPLDHDPRCDPIVRSEAHRLRAKLESYYACEGSTDPIAIEMPKGSYLPQFRANRVGAPGRPGDCRVAVTDFAEGGPRNRAWGFGPAMADGISRRLAGRPGLRVVHRGPRSALRPEDAHYAVSGIFGRRGARCELATRVVRVADDKEIWAGTHHFPWKRVAQVQDEVAEQISASVGSFLDGPTASPRAGDPHVYEVLIKARHSVMQFANTHHPEYLAPACKRLQRVLELEPDNVDALAELAHVHVLQLYPPHGDPAEHLARARALLDRALAADPLHVQGLCLLGQVRAQEGRRREALDLTETAVALDPDDAEARAFRALCHLRLGFYEAALVDCEHALDLDPLWQFPHQARALCLAYLGRFAEAHGAVDALLREDPDTPQTDTTRALVRIAEGDLDGAAASLERSRRTVSPLYDAVQIGVAEGLVAALRGDTRSARALLDEHRGSPPRFQDHLVRLALALGDLDVALAHLGPATFHGNYRWLVEEPLAHPRFADPRLRARLEELHREWLRDVKGLARRLPARPPPLPAPGEFLGDARAAAS